MRKLDRQGFLKAAGTGSAAIAAAGALPASHVLASSGADGAERILTIRAVAQLPAKPLAGYASCVLSGHIDVAARAGLLSQTIFAGPPEAMSEIGLPGLSRTIRVSDVREVDGVLHVTGLVDDRSQLEKGESPKVSLRIDRARGVATARFGGSEIRLRLESE